jgi:hypothetical protein
MQIESRPLDARLSTKPLADLKDPSAILENIQTITKSAAFGALSYKVNRRCQDRTSTRPRCRC